MSKFKRKLRESEYRLLNIVWRFEPLSPALLAGIAESELGWKKSTTLRMLKRLLSAGYCSEENAEVSSAVNPNEIEIDNPYSADEPEKRRLWDFLPKFVTTFIRDEIFTEDEARFIVNELYHR